MSRCNQPPSRALQQPTRQVALRQDAGGARLSLLSLGEFLTLLDTFWFEVAVDDIWWIAQPGGDGWQPVPWVLLPPSSPPDAWNGETLIILIIIPLF